ncbi:helix-turn-helix domain-containing protein [Victivallis sp. Marseille-Q1083]|uniref:helix-turn-helix domain-containing protein n=1 Tax=Victivallis sp. Marseille-Q1083 TaxID=2717288 RepID=UPI00158EB8A3|nr:helix-turn-helix domain-containing protein [Victivallis sp. Marseille-Q1083]
MTRKRILLYLDRSFQELKSAIFNYAEQTDWQLEVATIHFPSRWHGDGILTDYLEPEQFESLSKDIPIVARSAFFAPNVYNVIGNMRYSAQLAVEYFYNRGFRHFATVEENRQYYPGFQMIEEEMERLLQRYHLPLHLLYWSGENREYGKLSYEQIYERVCSFLRGLPLPCALFSPNISYVPMLSRAIKDCGLKIPNDIALLSNGDEPDITLHTEPPTSAIAGELYEIGVLMAKALDDLIAGRPVPNPLPQPTNMTIITRQSTDILSIADPRLYRAINYLRQNHASSISIVDAADAAGISLSQLKLLMRRELQLSPGKFLKDLRLSHARELLLKTDQPLEPIARQCGYSSAAALIQAFKQAYGHSPGSERFRQGNRP